MQWGDGGPRQRLQLRSLRLAPAGLEAERDCHDERGRVVDASRADGSLLAGGELLRSGASRWSRCSSRPCCSPPASRSRSRPSSRRPGPPAAARPSPRTASACARSRASCASGGGDAAGAVRHRRKQRAPQRFIGEPDRVRFVADLPDYLGRGGPYLHDFDDRGRRRRPTHHPGADDGAGRRAGRGTRSRVRRRCWSKACARRASATARAPKAAGWATGRTRWETVEQLPLLVEVTLTDADGRAWPPLVVGLPLASTHAARRRRDEPRPPRARSRAQRGAALLLVLWLIALLTALVGGFALTARVEQMQGRVLVRGLAAAERRARRDRVRPEPRRADRPAPPVAGRRPPLSWRYADAAVEVSLVDEDGKVDLNQADAPLLAALLRASAPTAAGRATGRRRSSTGAIRTR